MNNGSSMKELSLVILSEDLDKVNETIIGHACLHPFKMDAMDDWAKNLDEFHTESALQEYLSVEKRIDFLCSRINFDLNYSSAVFKKIKNELVKLKTKDVSKQIIDLESQIKSLDDQDSLLDEKISNLKELNNRYSMFEEMLELPKKQSYSILDQFTGKIPSSNLKYLQDNLTRHPHLLIPVKENPPWTVVILYSLKRESISIKKLLEKSNFQQISLDTEFEGSPKDILDKVNNNILMMKKAKSDLVEKRKNLFEHIRKNIVIYGYFFHYNSLLLKAQKFFKKTDKTCVISGWVPNDMLPNLIKDIKNAVNGRCYYEIHNPVDLHRSYTQVPFKFNDNKLIKPFELLVKAYGVPNYSTINPTPFFALTFLLMFGFMFADAGHGLILVLCGLYLMLKKSFKITVRQVGLLLVLCGSSSTFFGVMFGSVFGNEKIIAPVWIYPMRNIDMILKISLFFGIGMISAGIIINVVNFILTRKWSDAIFHKTGLLSGFIYWGLLGLIVKSFVLKHNVPGWLWFLIVGVPIIILFFKAPFEKIIGQGSFQRNEGVFAYLMNTVFEIVEIFMGYIANTFSFIRVGAFALSHVGLFFAVFNLAKMLGEGSFGTIASTIIIILGNILVLVLEGMIVTIQTIRLEYYEFFSKFFPGDGTLYKPLSIQENN
ncbi:hypothetical protein J7L67_05870 [bacterium]|nr:hypothetical protein [bacterium]